MNYKKIKDFYIFSTAKSTLDEDFVFEIENFKNKKGFQFAIDCKKIENIASKKVSDFIFKNKIALFGTNTDFLLQLNLLSGNNICDIYLNFEDCISKKRKFIKRNFRLIKKSR